MIKRLATIALAAGLMFSASQLSAQCCSGHSGSGCTKGQQQQRTPEKGAGISEINKEKLQKMLSAGGVTVLDARSQDQYDAGHIQGAVLFASNVLPADKNAALVFYCGGVRCPASHKAAKKALELGYTNVMVYKDGWAGWSANS